MQCDQLGQAEEQIGARPSGQSRPGTVEGRPRRDHSTIDIGRLGLADLGEMSAGRRIEGGEHAAFFRFDPFAADKERVRLAQKGTNRGGHAGVGHRRHRGQIQPYRARAARTGAKSAT